MPSYTVILEGWCPARATALVHAETKEGAVDAVLEQARDLAWTAEVDGQSVMRIDVAGVEEG